MVLAETLLLESDKINYSNGNNVKKLKLEDNLVRFKWGNYSNFGRLTCECLSLG